MRTDRSEADERGDWRRLARCRSTTPGVMAPLSVDTLALALAWCAACPITGTDGPCYRTASREDLYWSVRGGQVPLVFRERDAAQARRTARAHQPHPDQQSLILA